MGRQNATRSCHNAYSPWATLQLLDEQGVTLHTCIPECESQTTAEPRRFHRLDDASSRRETTTHFPSAIVADRTCAFTSGERIRGQASSAVARDGGLHRIRKEGPHPSRCARDLGADRCVSPSQSHAWPQIWTEVEGGGGNTQRSHLCDWVVAGDGCPLDHGAQSGLRTACADLRILERSTIPPMMNTCGPTLCYE